MKELPILMSAPMVRATLADRKTQTRRIVKPQPVHQLSELDKTDPVKGWQIPGHSGIWGDDDATDRRWKCPYGIPGGRLWVKETFALWDGGTHARSAGQGVSFRADSLNDRGVEDADSKRERLVFDVKWKPSIFMPRRFSRLTLKVISIHIERLQQIYEADAWAEGCKQGDPTDNGGFFPAEEPDPSGIGFRGWDTAKDWYQDLWENIHGPNSWDQNPWVWVLTFMRQT